MEVSVCLQHSSQCCFPMNSEWINVEVTYVCSPYFSDMYIAAGEYGKAVEIMGENGWVDRYVCTYI